MELARKSFASRNFTLGIFNRFATQLNLVERKFATVDTSTASRYFSKGFPRLLGWYSFITIFSSELSLAASRAKYAYLSAPAENGLEALLKVKLLEKSLDLLK